MKVILQEDVKSLGKVGDVVKVKDGYARNFLLPRKLAVESTERRVAEFEHLQKVAESKKKKAQSEKQEKPNTITLGWHTCSSRRDD